MSSHVNTPNMHGTPAEAHSQQNLVTTINHKFQNDKTLRARKDLRDGYGGPWGCRRLFKGRGDYQGRKAELHQRKCKKETRILK